MASPNESRRSPSGDGDFPRPGAEEVSGYLRSSGSGVRTPPGAPGQVGSNPETYLRTLRLSTPCLQRPATTSSAPAGIFGRTSPATRRSRIAKRAEGLVLDGRGSGGYGFPGRQVPVPAHPHELVLLAFMLCSSPHVAVAHACGGVGGRTASIRLVHRSRR